jgi:4a-hydroxytetrahydrobiopterin dehydratase
MEDLLSKKCVPCEGGMPPLNAEEVAIYLAQVTGWSVDAAGKVLSKEFAFMDFANALAFADKIGAVAEEEGHHPDLLVAWGKVGVSLSTHEIGGLSENDFILAAKIDDLQHPVI